MVSGAPNSQSSIPSKPSHLPLLFIASIILRLLIPSPYFETRHELSTPLTSISRLRECAWMWNHGLELYDGDMCHHAPGVVLAYSALGRILGGRWWESGLWAGIDFWGGWMMVKISRSLRLGRRERDVRGMDLVVGAAYLLNPYVVLTNLAHSSSSLINALILTTLYYALDLQHSISFEAVLACVGTVLMGGGFHAALIVVPTTIILTTPNWRLFMGFFLVAFMLAGALIQHNVFPGYLTNVLIAPLTSNVDTSPDTGLWWYFNIQIFDAFRDFFTWVSSLHLLIYVIPLCIKFGNTHQSRQQPMILPTALAGIVAAFGTYPSPSHTALPLSLLALSPALLPYLTHPFLTLLTLLFSSILLPVFGELWLGRGSGNANFGWAVGMVWVLGQMWGVVDLVGAGVRGAWDEEGDRIGERRGGTGLCRCRLERNVRQGCRWIGGCNVDLFPIAGGGAYLAESLGRAGRES